MQAPRCRTLSRRSWDARRKLHPSPVTCWLVAPARRPKPSPRSDSLNICFHSAANTGFLLVPGRALSQGTISGGPAPLRTYFPERVGHSSAKLALRLCLGVSRLQPRSAGRTGTHSPPYLLRQSIPVVCRSRPQKRTIRHRAAWRISPRPSACRVRVNSVGDCNCRSKRLHSADLGTKNVRAATRLFRGARLVLVPPSGWGLCLAIVGPILLNVYRQIQHCGGGLLLPKEDQVHGEKHGHSTGDCLNQITPGHRFCCNLG